MLLSEQMPNLYRRRLARVWAYPWGQLIVGLVLAAWSWREGVNPAIVLAWIAFVAPCLVVEDLATRASVLRRWQGETITKRGQEARPRAELAQENEVYYTQPPPNWFGKRIVYRRNAAIVLLVASWGYALAIGWGAYVRDPAIRLALLVWVMLFPLIPLAVSIVPAGSPTKYEHWLQGGLISVLAFLVTSLSAANVVGVGRPIDWAATAGLMALAYFSAYTASRLWAGESAYHKALNQVSLELLDQGDPARIEETVAELVRTHFRYDRVYVLKPARGKDCLEITYASGKDSVVLGHEAGYATSITGRAYSSGRAAAWNDVGQCDYYHEVPELIDTRAEIAVPVMHQGEKFAVLDVQSVHKGVFAPLDTETLATIGRMLGAAIASNRNKEIIGGMRDLWKELDEISQVNPANEREAFDLFATFAKERFGAEPVVYFPLSLTGRPIHTPLTMGLTHEEAVVLPLDDEDSSLLRLIDRWETAYISHVDSESIVTQYTPPGKVSFVERQGVKSACFVPIGPRQGRLGALFLNFRKPIEFDDTFKFAVEGFAQAMSELASSLRYRTTYSTGFGRPELNIHAILNHNGLKVDGIQTKAEGILMHSENGHELATCPLAELIGQLDQTFRYVSLAEAGIPPSFGGDTGLEYELRKFQGDLAKSFKAAPPQINYAIDRPIEQESPLTRLALYRVITEAVTNAIVHANAQQVTVTVRRLPMTIHVEVVNDGHPLSEGARRDAGKRGIYWLLEECKKQMGADDHNTPATRGLHTLVEVSIPALPWNN